MGQDFFVRWNGLKDFELIHQGDLERRLNEGGKAEEIYTAGDSVNSMSFDDNIGEGEKRVRLFVFI